MSDAIQSKCKAENQANQRLNPSARAGEDEMRWRVPLKQGKRAKASSLQLFAYLDPQQTGWRPHTSAQVICSAEPADSQAPLPCKHPPQTQPGTAFNLGTSRPLQVDAYN